MLYLAGSFIFRFTIAIIGFLVAMVSTPEVFGQFSSAYTINSAVVTLLIAGVSEYLLLLSKSPAWQEMYRAALRLTFGLFLLLLIGYFVYEANLLFYIGIWLLSYRLLTNYYSVYLIKYNKLTVLALILLSQSVFCIVYLIYFAGTNVELTTTFKDLCIGSFVINAISSAFIGLTNIFSNTKKYFELVNKSWRFILSPMLAYFYMTFNIVLLKYVVGDEEAGIYSLALTFALLVFAVLDIGVKLFFNRVAEDKAEKLTVLFFNFCLYVGLGYLLTLLINLELVVGIFDEGYSLLSDAVLFILPAIFLHVFIYYFVYLLLIEGRVKERNRVQAFVAVLSITLSIVLVEFVGFYGAFIGFLISELMLFIGYGKLVRFKGIKGDHHSLLLLISLIPLIVLCATVYVVDLELDHVLCISVVAVLLSLLFNKSLILNIYKEILKV